MNTSKFFLYAKAVLLYFKPALAISSVPFFAPPITIYFDPPSSNTLPPVFAAPFTSEPLPKVATSNAKPTMPIVKATPSPSRIPR